jgi:hypothetical protein
VATHNQDTADKARRWQRILPAVAALLAAALIGAASYAAPAVSAPVTATAPATEPVPPVAGTDREALLAGGYTVETVAVSPASSDTWQVVVGSAAAFVKPPARLAPLKTILFNEAGPDGLKVVSPTLSGIGDRLLLGCQLKGPADARILTCTFDKAAKDRANLAWLVIEVGDQATKRIWQVPLGRPPVVESRVEFGYTATGAKVGTNPVSFTYPWPDLLVLAVKDGDRKSEKPLIVAGGSGVTLDWKEGAASVSLHLAVKVSGQTVTCTPDLASLGDIDQAAGAVFTAWQAAATDPMAPTIDLLKKQIADKQSQLDLAVRMVSSAATASDGYVNTTYTARVTQYQKELEALNARLADAMRTSSSSGVKTSAQVAEKEKALQALLEAHAKAVASHGPVQVLDPWGVPVATCNLDFQMCDVDVLVNQRGKTMPHTAVTPTARPVPTPTARPVPTRTTGGRPPFSGVGASPSTSSGSLFTPGPKSATPGAGSAPSSTGYYPLKGSL